VPARAARRTAATAPPKAGVDEAGRGPVLGPLVVAGVLADDERALAALGVKDSKKLAPARRETLDLAIRGAAAAVVVRVAEPAELDRAMARGSLNALEAELFAEVLDALGADEAAVDACDVDAKRFGLAVGARMARPCRIASEHKADARHPVVSAASIVAKVERDRLMAEVGRALGRDVGSGYASDPTTQRFLADWHREHGDVPACARRRWETTRRLLAPRAASLAEFEEGSP